jgi:hypothetical protein
MTCSFPCYVCFWRWCLPSVTLNSRKAIAISPQINAPIVGVNLVTAQVPNGAGGWVPAQYAAPMMYGNAPGPQMQMHMQPQQSPQPNYTR